MKKLALFLLFLINTTQVKTFSGGQDLSELEANIQNCICVPYWQCKDNITLGPVSNFADAIDIRFTFRNFRNAHNKDQYGCLGEYDTCCKVECGKKPIKYQNISSRMWPPRDEVIGFRILGDNNEAEFGEFPWMLGLLKGRVYKCGASLIHPRVAMTAAHCVSGEGPFKVRAGEWNWEDASEPLPHQNRAVEKVIIHPQYNPGSLRNDIALLIVDEPFVLAENVGITCIPEMPTARHNFERCIATGWGKNGYKNGVYQSTLKKVDLPIVPRPMCTRLLQEAILGPYFKLHQSFMCAGGEEHKDTCKGDGGSPLVCPIIGQPDRFEQVGIVSWGLTCGLASTPGVYVNVALFRDWIDNIMSLHDFDNNIYKY